MMDALSDVSINTVVIMSSAQIGKTEMLLNAIGKYVDLDPCPILVLQPTLQMAEAFSKDRVAPMLRDTPALLGKVNDPRARDSGNTLLHKALDIATPIATPSGWSTMGELKVGDYVFDAEGKPTRVLYVTPVQLNRPCYKITFSDGEEIISDESHPWRAFKWIVKKQKGVNPKQESVEALVTTIDFFNSQRANGRKKYSIANAKPLDLPARELLVDPYILGAWLGDGYSHAAKIAAGLDDAEIGDLLKNAGAKGVRASFKSRIIEFSLDPEYGLEEACRYGHSRAESGRNTEGKCKLCISRKSKADRAGEPREARTPNSIRSALGELGLLSRAGSGSSKKHIPAEYLRSSIAQRLSLLQGLMDTDGSIRSDGSYCIFASSIEKLKDGVCELLSSLGIKFSIKIRWTTYKYKGEKKIGKKSWVIGFTPDRSIPVFRLTRKAIRQTGNARDLTSSATRRRVVSCVHVDSVPVRCISVDSKDHLYLAGARMVPTHNTFPGGHITFAGSNSPSSLASRPIRVVLCDEVDRYPLSAGTEGDPVSLAKKRSTTFWNRLLLLTSTPTIKGVSRIEAAYEQSDQRKFFVPCHACGEYQVLKWAHVRWPSGQPLDAHYECEACAAKWGDTHKLRAIGKGEWRATKPDVKGIAGFWINEIYSPWVTLGEMAENFTLAKQNSETLKTFVNTSLAETFEEENERLNENALYARRERYDAEIPEPVQILTFGADVQADRIELEVVGWGNGDESWGIEYRVFYGDTSHRLAWDSLREYLAARTFQTASGRILNLSAGCIDSGYNTDMVYAFVKPLQGRRIFATKGKGGPGLPIVDAPKERKTAQQKLPVKLFSIGVDGAKDILFSRLSQTVTGPGYCHFPESYTLDFFEQLTAERKVFHRNKGQVTVEYQKIRPRNEALDIRVLNFAAIKILNPVWQGQQAQARKRDKPKAQNEWVGQVDNWLSR